MFRNNLFRKHTVKESRAPSLLQREKRRSAKSEVSKVLFPDIGKITNRLFLMVHVHVLALVVIHNIRTRHAVNTSLVISGTSRVIGWNRGYRMEEVILTAI